MPVSTQRIQSRIWESQKIWSLARVVKADGTLLKDTDFDDTGTIVLNVYRWGGTTPATVIDTPTITEADVIFDDLQTDGKWTVDSTGYNFAYEWDPGAADTTAAIQGGNSYTLEYVMTTDDGEIAIVVHDVALAPVISKVAT